MCVRVLEMARGLSTPLMSCGREGEYTAILASALLASPVLRGHCGAGDIRAYNFCAGIALLWLRGDE